MPVSRDRTVKTTTNRRSDGNRSRGARSGHGGDERSVQILGSVALFTVTGTTDARIGQIAAQQNNRVARRQLLAAGVTDHMIRSRLRSGLLTQRHTGVYIAGPVIEIPYGRETEALLAVERSVLSHLTAGTTYEIIRVRDGVPIHLTVRTARNSRPGIVVHRSRTISRRDITTYHGLPITTVARTLMDIAELLPPREVEWALDEALGRRLVTLQEIRELLGRIHNRHGANVLRTLIAWRTTSAAGRTKWQRLAYRAFVDAGLPEPEQDVWYLGYQHDFLWRKHGVTLEIDGFPWHGLKTRIERDRTKETTLENHGLDPSRVTNTDVETRILGVVALVAGRLARRDPELRRTAAGG